MVFRVENCHQYILTGLLLNKTKVRNLQNKVIPWKTAKKQNKEKTKGLNNVSRQSIYILICTHNSDGLFVRYR